jgi:hypothetical protein
MGEDSVLGVNVVRVVAYLSSAFSEYRKITNPIAIVTDEQIESKWDGTFICFGSSDSNVKTYDIEHLPEQDFYTFDFGPNGFRRYNIAGRSYSAGQGRDYGVLLRIKNPRQPEHFLFVCAGLGEWGTSGTTYYLFDNWKEIYKEFTRDNFCMIIEVDVGSDESARKVYSISH